MKDSNHFKADSLLSLIYKYRKLLIILCLGASIVSAFSSLLIENKYKSTLTMYPTTINSASVGLLNSSEFTKNDYLGFGNEKQVDQMLQILQSEEIQQRIIAKYQLLKHYEIDTSKKFHITELNKKFSNNIKFSRTKFLSVQIEVLDKDPIYAANIANDIGNLYDTIKLKINRSIASEAFLTIQRHYLKQKKYLKSIEDSLENLSDIGVNDYELQVQNLSENISQAIVLGKSKALNILENKMRILGKHGSKFLSLKAELENINDYLSDIYSNYQNTLVDLNSKIKSKFIVNKAVPAEKKSYPIRWLIVVISTLSTFMTVLFGLIIKEKVGDFKTQE